MSESADLPMNFGGITEEGYSTFDNARVLVWPVAYEGTVSYGTGTGEGAMAIVDASRNMELYEEETGAEVYKIGIFTLDEFNSRPTPDLMMNALYDHTVELLDSGKFVCMLLPLFDRTLAETNIAAEIIIVDDGSMTSIDATDLKTLHFENIGQVSVVELKRNLGHQRAIALGLAYVSAERDCEAVLVMDGDGEDRPEDAMRLVEACREYEFRSMIFARRSKRSEGFSFQFFYNIYKFLYRLLTGREIRFGNFSAVPRQVLKRLVVVSEIWNNYAGGAMKSRVPIVEIDTKRGNRLSGKSSMSFISLVTHG